MKKNQSVLYILKDISDGKKKAFKAIIPEMNNGVVYGSCIKEIEKGIKMAVEFEKKEQRVNLASVKH